MLKYLFLVGGFFIIAVGFAQTPRANFNLPEEVCKDENIFIQNQSSNASTYLWDFCSGDLAETPVASSINTDEAIDGANNVTVVESNGNFFGFVASRFNSKLIRMDFGDNPDNTPQLIDLGNIGNLLEEPIAVEIVENGGTWYGLLIDFKSFKLFRLNFGNSLKNAPSIEAIEQSVLNKPLATATLKENGELILQIGNFGNGNITSFNFGSSPANTPVVFDYNITSRPIGGISYIKESNIWYGLATEFRDRFGRVLKLKYTNGLNSAPQIEAVALGNVNKYLTGISFAREGGVLYAFLQLRLSNELYRIAFTDGINQNPAVENLGDLGVLDSGWGLKILEKESVWQLFTVKNNGQVFRISFPNICNATQAISHSIVPKQISFNQLGTYSITLTAYDEFGNRDDTTQFITVTNDQAPLIDFQSDQCFGSTSTLTATADQSLDLATWSINGQTLTGETVTYDFPTPGTYPVTLEVESANGCSNRLTKEITIYEPPVPGFSFPAGTVCTNGAVPFTNTTDVRLADEIIAYRWYVTDADNNEALVSEVASPAITFGSGGEKTVRLEAEIPGCTEIIEQAITVLAGPTVAFSATPACQGNSVTFTNATTGTDITGYSWDFADGSTFASVTPESPTHTFAVAGDYPVSLTVTNTSGCQNVYQQIITVYEQPTVSFLSEVACSGTPTQFTDASTAGTNANVVAWQWDFGDGIGSASIRNPTYAYLQAGTYAVKLITQSSAGCTDSTTQTVTVVSAVDVGFVALRQCPTGAPQPEARPLNVLLSDTSMAAAGETIDRWFWTVNGDNFVSAEVEVAFPAPGDYPVSLTVFTASGCNATVQRIVSVTTSPAVAFTSFGSCTGQPVAFQEEVDAPGWGELNYTWDFGGEGTDTVANPEFVFDAPGTYDVTLTVQTPNACSFTTTQSVTVAATPVATFTASPDYGGAPMEVTFANASTNTTAYAWDFGGLSTSEEAEPTVTFTDTGTYVVTLVATNAAGCASTTQQTVEVVRPVQDLRLDDFSVVESTSGNGQQLLLTISNRGTRVVPGLTATVTFDESLTLEEPIAEPLLPGETRVHATRFRLPNAPRNAQRPLRYLCVGIAANLADFTEENTDNNRDCRSLNEQLNVEPPFPNPATELLRVSVILPAAEAVSLRLIDQEGKIMRTHRPETTAVGLNTFLLNVKGLAVGAYVLQISYRGEQRQFRVAVGP